MSELTRSLYESNGVLPKEVPMPKFSLVEKRMAISHHDFANSLLARLLEYCEISEAEGRPPRIQEFSQLDKGENTYLTFRRLTGIVARTVGIDTKRRDGLKNFEPRLLTKRPGSERAIGIWRAQHTPWFSSTAEKVPSLPKYY